MILKFRSDYKNRTAFVYFILELENQYLVICNYYEKDKFNSQTKARILNNVEELRNRFKICRWSEI